MPESGRGDALAAIAIAAELGGDGGFHRPCVVAASRITSPGAAALVLRRASRRTTSRVQIEILANMRHELRTPLRAVLGFAARLRSEPQALGDPRCPR